jgi:hypothetical protein
LHEDIAEPVLIEFLESPNPEARLAAALALTRLGSLLGREALERLRERVGVEDIARINAAIMDMPAPPTRVTYGEITETDAASRMLLFDTGGRRLYYGQVVVVMRGGERVGTARINRRFTSEKAAAARLEDGEMPRAGDIVRTLESDGGNDGD